MSFHYKHLFNSNIQYLLFQHGIVAKACVKQIVICTIIYCSSQYRNTRKANVNSSLIAWVPIVQIILLSRCLNVCMFFLYIEQDDIVLKSDRRSTLHFINSELAVEIPPHPLPAKYSEKISSTFYSKNCVLNFKKNGNIANY